MHCVLQDGVAPIFIQLCIVLPTEHPAGLITYFAPAEFHTSHLSVCLWDVRREIVFVQDDQANKRGNAAPVFVTVSFLSFDDRVWTPQTLSRAVGQVVPFTHSHGSPVLGKLLSRRTPWWRSKNCSGSEENQRDCA